MIRYGIIYQATSPTGKIYIGKTGRALEIRKKQHQRDFLIKKSKFYSSIKKYGFKSFKWEILKDNIPIEELDIHEIWFISTFDTKVNGLNSTDGGEGTFNKKPSAAHKQNLSIALKGKNTWSKGRKISPEHIAKTSAGVRKSNEKRRQKTWIHINCKGCGNDIFKSPAKHKPFCCRACYWKWMKGQPSLKRQEYNIFCKFCKKQFIVFAAQKDRKFCSQECYYKIKEGKPIPHIDNRKNK